MGNRTLIGLTIAVLLSIASFIPVSLIPGADSIISSAALGNTAAIKLTGGVMFVFVIFWWLVVKKAWPHVTVEAKKHGKIVYKDVKYF